MNIKKIIYPFLLIVPFLSACSENDLVEKDIENPKTEEISEPGVTSFDVLLEGAELRTRDILFEEGSSVRINTLWIGVFDMANGNCVEKISPEQDYKFITSGVTAHGILRVSFKGPVNYSANKFFMFIVANYQNVYGRKAVDGKIQDYKLLSELLDGITSWDDFNSIGIETESAYAGEHKDDCPLMAGFLNSAANYQTNVNNNTHLKVNQFASTVSSSGDAVLDIVPATLANGTAVSSALAVKWDASNGRYVANTNDATALAHTIFFRRLVANMNVSIYVEADDEEFNDISITDVSYRRFNIPNYVYIVERCMWDPLTEDDTKKDFPTTANRRFSPNFGDLDFNGIFSRNGSPEKGYHDDDDNYVSIDDTEKPNTDQDYKNWQNSGVLIDSEGKWNFSFQHFANKHWARLGKSLIKYEDRERAVSYDTQGKNGNDIKRNYFTALCDGNKQNDINNNASYFVLKMHLTNAAKNRCAETEFTIHEGYTSDSDGKVTSEISTQLRDFSVARNINTNYTIRVKSFKQIRTNVNGNETDHRPDMGGKIWQIYYANETVDQNGEYAHDVRYIPGSSNEDRGNYKNAISKDGGVFRNALKIENEHPNMAFRLYGFDSSIRQIKGFNYNFPDNSFSWLRGMWPPSIDTGSRYFKDYQSLKDAYNKEFTTNVINDLLFRTFHILTEDDSKLYSDKKIMEFENKVVGRSDEEIKDIIKKDNDTALNDYLKKRMNIVQFIEFLNGDYPEENSGITGKDFKGNYTIIVAPRLIKASDYGITEANKGDFIRAVYFADRKGHTDKDGCSTLVNIFAAVQDPPIQ